MFFQQDLERAENPGDQDLIQQDVDENVPDGGEAAENENCFIGGKSFQMQNLNNENSASTSSKNRSSRKRKKIRMISSEKQMRIIRSSGVHLIDEEGDQYLDCVSGVSHVGHCHPEVRAATTAAFSRVSPVMRPENPAISTFSLGSSKKGPDGRCYSERILATLPSHMDTGLFFNSGSEANDMAIQISRNFTGENDILIFDCAFHGCMGTVSEISPKISTINRAKKSSKLKEMAKYARKTSSKWQFRSKYPNLPDHVTVLPVPDLYRGAHRDESDPWRSYLQDAKEVIDEHLKTGKKFACFISEPMFTFQSMTLPDREFFQNLVAYIRAKTGALIVMDEVQTGLGRLGGENLWGFQNLGIVPDLMTTGKPLGNGYPMSLVAGNRRVLSKALGGSYVLDQYRVDPIQSVVGNTVLDIIHKESLISNADQVHKHFVKEIHGIMEKHPGIGDVRGAGLLLGIDLVESKTCRTPARDLARTVMYELREKRRIMVSVGGEFENIIVLLPSMIFSKDNADTFIRELDSVLTALEAENSDEAEDEGTSRPNVPLDDEDDFVEDGNVVTDDEDEEAEFDPSTALAEYEELD